MYSSLHVYGVDIPTKVIPLLEESLTFITAEYQGRTFRFSVRGPHDGELEVSYLHEFEAGLPQQRVAWFPIDPQNAASPKVLQDYLYDQLALVHRHVMRQGAASELARPAR